MDTSEDMSDTIPEKFSQIKEYFKGLKKEDLAHYTCDEILESIPQKHRLVARIYLKSIRFGRNGDDDDDSDDEFSSYSSRSHKPYEMVIKDNQIDLHGKVITSNYKTWFQSRCIPMALIPSLLSKKLTTTKYDHKKPIILDLSNNNLTDKDLNIIHEAIVKVVNKSIRFVLFLHQNRFCNIDFMERLISIPNVDYVTCWANEIVAASNEDFFKRMMPYVKRIIYLPHVWIESDHYECLFPEPLAKRSRETHFEFYTQYPMK